MPTPLSSPRSAPVMSWLLHDPQPAGLAAELGDRGARVVWRCHVGTDGSNPRTDTGWEFLRRYLEPPMAAAYVFSRKGFAPPWIPSQLVHEIPPSIDPFSPKNCELSPVESESILTSVGLLAGTDRSADYPRSDGSRRRIDTGSTSFGPVHRPTRVSLWSSRSPAGTA